MLIYKAINGILNDIGAVSKSQKNAAQGYSFRGIDQFQNALHPLLAKHGVVIVPQVLERLEQVIKIERPNQAPRIDKHVSLKVQYAFIANDGSKIETVVYGEGVDPGDKATNKAMSAAMKYCLIQTFCIPTEDQVDGDADDVKNISWCEETVKNVNEPQSTVQTHSQNSKNVSKNSSPICCDKPMMISKYIDKNFGHAPYYCLKCHTKLPAQ